jgi:hypothetical protein
MKPRKGAPEDDELRALIDRHLRAALKRPAMRRLVKTAEMQRLVKEAAQAIFPELVDEAVVLRERQDDARWRREDAERETARRAHAAAERKNPTIPMPHGAALQCYEAAKAAGIFRWPRLEHVYRFIAYKCDGGLSVDLWLLEIARGIHSSENRLTSVHRNLEHLTAAGCLERDDWTRRTTYSLRYIAPASHGEEGVGQIARPALRPGGGS